MPTILFNPQGVQASCEQGETIFEVARRNELEVDTSCVGKGTCGLCRVKILDGESHLNPYSAVDEKHLGNLYHLTKIRLSCQAVVDGDIEVQLLPRKKKKKK